MNANKSVAETLNKWMGGWGPTVHPGMRCYYFYVPTPTHLPLYHSYYYYMHAKIHPQPDNLPIIIIINEMDEYQRKSKYWEW